ncbi:MAG: hypothetical protein ACPGRZ_16350 [Alphaproteobacteria bacterium]
MGIILAIGLFCFNFLWLMSHLLLLWTEYRLLKRYNDGRCGLGLWFRRRRVFGSADYQSRNYREDKRRVHLARIELISFVAAVVWLLVVLPLSH